MRDDEEREYVDYVTARLPRLHRAAFLLCGDADRADDLVQAAITKLYVHWFRARAADNLDGYVHRILVRSFIDQKRLAWARVRLVESPPEPPAAPELDLDTRSMVQEALTRLPKGQRTVLVLRFFCDLSVEDAAAAMRCSTGNVKSQTARGLAALRRVLGERSFTAACSGPGRAGMQPRGSVA